MLKAFIYGIAGALTMLALLLLLHKPASSCKAPCDVVFPANTEEDQFDFNYWVMAKDGLPRLQVWIRKGG